MRAERKRQMIDFLECVAHAWVTSHLPDVAVLASSGDQQLKREADVSSVTLHYQL